MMTGAYTLRFCTAERRSVEERFSCRLHTTQCDEHLMIRDVYLPAGTDVTLSAAGYDQHIVVPVSGEVLFTSPDEAEWPVAPGQLVGSFARGVEFFTAHNAAPGDAANFLHIAIRDTALIAPAGSRSMALVALTEKNKMIAGTGWAAHLHIGVYDGRVKDEYAVRPGHRLVAYVINGSLEVEERLMEYRDALCLWDTPYIEYHALTEAAILLLIEYSPTKYS